MFAAHKRSRRNGAGLVMELQDDFMQNDAGSAATPVSPASARADRALYSCFVELPLYVVTTASLYHLTYKKTIEMLQAHTVYLCCITPKLYEQI